LEYHDTGYTQSGSLFHAKTRAVEKLMTKALASFNLVPRLHYPTGPNQLRASDIPGYEASTAGEEESDAAADTWAWYRKDDATGSYRFLTEGMQAVAAAIRACGGVDGVVGFSQGGAMAAMVAAAMEDKRTPASDVSWARELREANNGKPLAFSVVYSGFYAPPEDLAWMYEPKIATPTLHFIGSLDTVVDESRSQGLVDRCKDPVVVVHPGGHYVPVSKEWAMPLIGFIKQRVESEPSVTMHI
jgi:pimeloyl-ACP methyl ester carboxylesterase